VNWRGFGADPAEVNWASVIAAANICDENVTIPGSTTQKRYTADGALTTGEVPADNLEQLLTSMLGQMTYSSDGYRLFAGAWQAPTLALTETDLAGEIACTADTPRADRYNAVKGTRWDTETGQEVEFLPRTSPTYETEDGAQLFREIELPLTVDEYRAQRIAQIILRRSREQETIVMHCNPGALRVGVWETVSVTLSELGISAKTYRCLSRDEHEDDSVTLTLREEASATYNDPAVEDYGDLTPANPVPVNGDALDAPTNLVATSVQGGILFTVTPDDANGPGVVYELFEYTSSTPFASSDLIWTGTATSFVIGKTDSTLRYYWIRARRGAAVSDTYPASTGTGGRALASGVPPIPDPYFQYSTTNKEYWDWGSATGVSISLTGGVFGGKLSLTGDSSSKRVYSRRTPNWPVVTGQKYNLYIRWRRTGTLGGTDEIYFDGTTSNGQPPDDIAGGSAGMTGSGTISSINTFTVNEWQESVVELTVANLPKNQTQHAYGYFWVEMPAAVTSGTVEIDSLIATPI
jgi:hypothetical protein